jgi:hypothetical protein
MGFMSSFAHQTAKADAGKSVVKEGDAQPAVDVATRALSSRSWPDQLAWQLF